jgi:hypothetical protein
MAIERLPDRDAVGQTPHSHRAVATAADDDRGAIRQHPHRHGGHLMLAVQGLPDRGAVGEPPYPQRAVLAAGDDDRRAIGQRAHRHRVHPIGVPVQRLADRGAIGQSPHPHRTVAVAAAADDDRGAVRQHPDRHRVHPAGVAGEDLVAHGLTSVGPVGLPGPVWGGLGDAGGQAAVAELVGRQFESAGPCRPVEVGEEVGALPVHGGSGTRRGGPYGVEVGHQPCQIDADQVARILQELIEPTGGGGVFGRVVAQVAILPAGVLSLAEEHAEQGALVAGPVPQGEQLVGEGLVEQPGHRAGAPLCRRGLEQVVRGRGQAQGIEIGDAGAVAESGGEGKPGRIVQPGTAGVGERREQLTVAVAPLVGQPVQVLGQRLADPGRNAVRIKSLRGRIGDCAGGGQRDGGHRGDQEVPPGPPGDDGGQPVTCPGLGAVLGPGGAGRTGVVHPVLGEQRGGELTQALEVEVGVAVQVDEIVIVSGGHAERGQQRARRKRVARSHRPGGHGDPQPGQHG